MAAVNMERDDLLNVLLPIYLLRETFLVFTEKRKNMFQKTKVDFNLTEFKSYKS